MAHAEHEARLQRLRALATTTTTSEWGRERVRGLLDQEPDAPGAQCPRFAVLAEHAGERMLFCSDDPAAIAAELAELAVGGLPLSTEAVIDLDTGARHAASTRASVTFTPPLPGSAPRSAGEPRQATLTYGHRGALKLAADIIAEHTREAGEHEELTDTVRWLEDLLAQWETTPPAASPPA
jgi:hypothetical protein